MAKITKKAEILETLNKLMSKEAELAQTNVSGEPCKDTKVTSISESTETTDKNNVGADKLNSEQGYEQKPSSDESEPVATAKKAEDATPVVDNTTDINKVAASILDIINTKLAAQAQTGISGTPLKDTKATSISDSTETTDKNNVGADKLNSEQGYEQKDSKDKSEPVATAKKAEDAELSAKIASYELGRQFCEVLLKKTASAKQSDAELLKEAGRRDFDTLIAQAASELEQQQAEEAEQQKLAEYQGAVAFDELYKQAQYEALLEDNKQLSAKLAEYAQQEQERLEKEAQVARANEIEKIAELVFTKLKSELSTTAAVPVASK